MVEKWLYIIAFSITLQACAVPLVEDKSSENNKAKILFDELFDAAVARSPMWEGYLGITNNNDQWDDISENSLLENLVFTKQQLKQLQTIDVNKLDESTRLSYSMYEKSLLDEIEDFKWRHHNYPVNQMFGKHSQAPSFLINIHQVTEEKDAEAYISRLNKVPQLIAQLIEGLKLRKEKGIVAPQFVFTHVVRDSENVISGHPFEVGEDNTLLADFKKKVAALSLDESQEKDFVSRAELALKKSVGPHIKNSFNI